MLRVPADLGEDAVPALRDRAVVVRPRPEVDRDDFARAETERDLFPPADLVREELVFLDPFADPVVERLPDVREPPPDFDEVRAVPVARVRPR